ncbi:hypothetical protein ACWGID_10195 [Kribbella sp. NPDC054772]
MDLFWLVAIMVAAALVLWVLRRKLAAAEVNRLVERGGLPAEPELVGAASKWYLRRQEILLLGLLIGILAGGAIAWLAHQGVGVGLTTGVGIDIRLLTWMLALAAAAGGLANLVHSYRTVRLSRANGPRMAALRPRQLVDYLGPIEIAIQYAVVVLPLVTIGLGGLVVLGSDDHPARGWILIGSGLAAVPLWGCGLLLQRKALQVSQSSSRDAELHWQEAMRATTLRDLGSSAVTVCWLLGAGIPMSFEWPSDIPGFVDPLVSVLFLVAVGFFSVTSMAASSRSGLQRVQRVAG